jgi:hypothetical protein
MHVILFALFLAEPARQSVSCGNGVHARTDALNNYEGTKVFLKMDGEDDHGKNTHLCQSDYAFVVYSQNGRSIEHTIMTSDDEWSRPIELAATGWVGGGRRFIATISEGGPHPLREVAVYDSSADAVTSWTIPQSFVRTIDRLCGVAIETVGTTPDGSPVLRIQGDERRCNRWQGYWRLKRGILVKGKETDATPMRLASDAKVMLRDPGLVF